MIEATGLVKSFGHIAAVSGVSFKAVPGTVLGLLGPNGAGKSTLMRILVGYHLPDSGSVKICGRDMLTDTVAVKGLIGYLPESFPVYPEMTVAEYLGFVAKMRNMAVSASRDSAMESCGITEIGNRLIGTLSKGYRQRVGFAQAILHNPPVLILDEPTSSLDPLQAEDIRTLIVRLGATKTILFSTHILSEAHDVCGEIIIMSDGKIAGRTIPGIDPNTSGSGILELRLKVSGQDTEGLADSLAASLARLPCISAVQSARIDRGAVSFRLALQPSLHLDSTIASPAEAVSSWARESGFLILGLSISESSLGDVFAALTRKDRSG